jgi:hypothetical protein
VKAQAASLACIALALAAAACSDPETVNPIDAGSSGSGANDAGPPPDAGPFVRSVTMRSPFGSSPRNLLADGDFEWSVSGGTGSQFAWLTFSSTGTPLVSRIETGGLCKSGLRCAVIDKNSVMLLRGASAPDLHAMNASIAIRPPAGGSCASVRAIALPCDTLSAPQHLLSTPLEGSADGWCTLAAVLPGSSSSTCIYVDALALPDQATALVDAATLFDTGSADAPAAAAIFQPEPALEARLARLREMIRGRMPVGRPPSKVHLATP